MTGVIAPLATPGRGPVLHRGGPLGAQRPEQEDQPERAVRRTLQIGDQVGGQLPGVGVRLVVLDELGGLLEQHRRLVLGRLATGVDQAGADPREQEVAHREHHDQAQQHRGRRPPGPAATRASGGAAAGSPAAAARRSRCRRCRPCRRVPPEPDPDHGRRRSAGGRRRRRAPASSPGLPGQGTSPPAGTRPDPPCSRRRGR